MEIAWAKSERQYKERLTPCGNSKWMKRLGTLQSQIDALTELWRHSAARAFDLDEECTANRILYERTANERDRLNKTKWP